MTINTNTWHYRWYTYWLANGRDNAPAYRENLCHYMWVLLFWAPMAWLAQRLQGIERWLRSNEGWIETGFVGLGTLYLLVCLGGLAYIVYLYPLWSLVAVVGTVLGLILAAIVLAGTLLFMERRTIPGLVTIQDTLSLVGSYLAAKKRRVCPFIEFKKL